MKKTIIGIHGLANKPPRETLKEWWISAIREGLEKNCSMTDPQFEFRMVYWADLFYKTPLHNDATFFFDAQFNEEPYVPAEAGMLQTHNDSRMDELLASARGVVGDAIDFLKENINFDVLTGPLLSKAVRDLAFYYDNDREVFDRQSVSKVAQQVLKEELQKTIIEEKDNEIMLIAHSMGTIISYDVLRDIGQEDPDVAVPYYITIGSPLGLPLVKGKIIDQRKYDPRVRTPSIVTKSWMNFADRKDPVAADTHLRDDYRGNKHNVRVIDDLVRNTYQRPKDGKRNQHKSYGYLRCPEVSTHIKKFLEE